MQGQIGLLDFPLIALFRGKQGILDQLLGNGGTALCGGRSQVEHKGAHNTLQVHTVMGIETGVFHCDKSIAKHLGHRGQRYQHPVFCSFVFSNQITVAIINERGLCLGIHCYQVQFGSRIHITLGNSGQCAQSGHTGKHHNHDQHPDRVQQHTDDKIRFPGFRAENTAGFRFVFRLLVIILVVLLVIPRPGRFLFISLVVVGLFSVVGFLVFIISGLFGIILRFVHRLVIRIRIPVFGELRFVAFIGRIFFEFFEVIFFPFLLTEHSNPPV